MGNPFRASAGIVLAVSVACSGLNAPVSRAAASQEALAYVLAGGVVVLENGNLTPVGTGQNPTWSPNGAHLLYINPDYAGNSAIAYVTDAHGAGGHSLAAGLYPYIAPTWSPDSNYVVYAAVPAGQQATTASFTLEVRAFRLSDKATKVLGRLPFTGGCSQESTALLDTMSKAQGGYRGTPNTLIWAQPSTVVVQSNCTGHGLAMFKVGSSKITTLKDWSGAALSPDGKDIAGVLTQGTATANTQVGLQSVAGGKPRLFSQKLLAGGVVWARNNKYLYAVSQPSDTLSGVTEVLRFSRDGKTVASLGHFLGAGAFHPSLSHGGTALAVAGVGSALANVGAPPPVLVYVFSTAPSINTPPRALITGGQPDWRP